MVSGLTRNQVPGNRLRVRLPCPPLEKASAIAEAFLFHCGAAVTRKSHFLDARNARKSYFR